MFPLLQKGSSKTDYSLHDALRKGNISDNDLEKLINSTSDDDLNSEDKDGRTPIFLAASLGNAHIFKLIQDKGGDMNITNRHGENLLHHAVIGGDLSIIENVLEQNEISLSAQDNEGNTIMHYVTLGKTKKNSTNVCKFLLEEGAILSIKNNENRTPYHLAVINQLYEILEMMLTMNSNGVLVQDENGHTPLQIAMDKNYEDIFLLLIDNSVNPFEKDFNGRTIIHNAILKGGIELAEIVLSSNKSFRGEANRIISYQEGLGYQDILNYTALHLAVEKGFEELLNLILTFKNCNTTTQRKCKDLELKTANYYDDTILHGAVRGGKSTILKKLLDHFEDHDSYIDLQNKDGQTPLHLAVQDGRTEMVESLLFKKANVTIKDKNDLHPLGLAASFEKLEILKALKNYTAWVDYNATELLGFAIANGNDENVIEELLNDIKELVPSDDGSTFLVPARGLDNEIDKHCDKICTITIKNCEKNTEEQKRAGKSLRIITADHEKFIKELAEEDEDESSHLFESKPTMLNYALFFNGKLSTVREIVNCSGTMAICDVCKINEAWSPIDIAAFRGKIDIVEYLINECKTQCNENLIEVRDNQEQTVMHKAAWGGQCTVLQYLHKYQKGNINEKDKWARTPLHIAALRGYRRALKCILELNSASLNWKDIYSFTPLHLAEIYGHHKFFTALQQTSITVDSQVRYKMKYPGTNNRLRNHTDAIHFLLENGANPNAQDGTLGWSPLHWAAANGDIEVVKMLINNKIKAKVNLPSKSDQTPMYLARFWGRMDVYNYLKTHNAVW